MRFGREMDGENINAPLLSLDGSCLPYSLFQRRPRQVSGVTTQSFRQQQSTCMWSIVSFGRMVFSSLNTPSRFLSESNSPV